MIVVIVAGGCALLIRSEFAPRQLGTLDLIEKRTGWVFPPETRILTAARGHLAMDVAIWAVLEVPREDVREVLTHPQTGQFTTAEGGDGFPEVCTHMAGAYWKFAPDWTPPLPRRFARYLAVSRFEPASYDVREAIAEMDDGGSEMVRVYVFYVTY